MERFEGRPLGSPVGDGSVTHQGVTVQALARTVRDKLLRNSMNLS
jgi:hypothetical protein